MIIEQDGTVSYAEKETDPRQVTVGGLFPDMLASTDSRVLGIWCRSCSLQVIDELTVS